MEQLFKSVFSNKYLFTLIFNHVKLLSNKKVRFNNRKDLLEYKEIDYIETIIYEGDELLIKGDLPINGVLKKIKFEARILATIKGDAIPFGVKSIKFAYNTKYETTSLSTLPSTIEKIDNAVILENKENQNLEIIHTIPSNIKSISFIKCPNISSFGNEYLIIPNTLRELNILNSNNEDDDEIELRKGDIPEGIISLKLLYYPIKLISSKDILPTTLKHIEIRGLLNDTYDFIPDNVESMYLTYSENQITPNSLLNQLVSIKNLHICTNGYYANIEPNSLPPNLQVFRIDNFFGKFKVGVLSPTTNSSITDLTIICMVYFRDKCFIEKGSIPNSVKSLKLGYTYIDEFPSSLTHLDIELYPEDIDNDEFISILPPSLTSIILPDQYKDDNDFKSKLPKSILSIK